jgi:hypothetical protein
MTTSLQRQVAARGAQAWLSLEKAAVRYPARGGTNDGTAKGSRRDAGDGAHDHAAGFVRPASTAGQRMRPALHAFEHAAHLPLMFAVALTAAMRDESDARSEVLDDEISPATGALPWIRTAHR